MRDKYTPLIVIGVVVLALFLIGNNFKLFSVTNPCDAEHFIADTGWIDEGSKSTVATNSYIGVRGSSTHHHTGFVKFKLSQDLIDSVKSGMIIDSAVLNVYVNYIANGIDVTVYTTSNSWNGNSLTYNNAPGTGTSVGSTKIYVASDGEWVKIPLSNLEQTIKNGDGYLSLELAGTNSNSPGEIRLGSKYSGGNYYTCNNGASAASYAPQLDVIYSKPECVYNQEKCNQLSWYTCQNGKWHEEGLIVGKCGYYSSPIQLGPNQLVAMETFGGGTSLKKSSLRYPPIVFGGTLLPAIIIDSSKNTVFTDPKVYDTLNNGGTIYIPSTQVYSVFYVIENNYQLPTVCSIVDLQTKQCAKVNPGLVTICSQGQFDPSLGLCVVQGESKIVCPSGGRYDTAQGVCIINPPLNYTCNIGKLTNIGNGNYACIYTPSTQINCPTGSIYNPQSDKCEYNPPTSNVCNSGFTYNPTTGKCESQAQAVCVQGTYDASRNACVYTPNIDYICTQGTLSADKKTCTVTPQTQVICPTDTSYDSSLQKCVKATDYFEVVDKTDWAKFWDNYKIYIIIAGVIFFVLIIGGKRR